MGSIIRSVVRGPCHCTIRRGCDVNLSLLFHLQGIQMCGGVICFCHFQELAKKKKKELAFEMSLKCALCKREIKIFFIIWLQLLSQFPGSQIIVDMFLP